MIVAGFGFRRHADVGSMRVALALATDKIVRVDALATPDDKVAALAPLADTLGLPVIAVSADRLHAAATWTRSQPSVDARGTGSVAEACALAAAGAGARLIASRRISPDRMATCAIAEGRSS